MENYHMNRSYTRPYQTTCGMTRPQMGPRMISHTDHSEPMCNETMRNNECCVSPAHTCPVPMLEHADHLAPAMAYVPCQPFTKAYDLCYALKAGTIFPELCKPFCGKRGGCR